MIDQLMAIARRIADPQTALGRRAREELTATSGLSPEGVELALSQHLETTASLTQPVTPAPRCHVVLAANVCTAPLRALVWAFATSPRVFVKPSRRDPVLATLLVEALDSPDVTLVDAIAPQPGDAVHVYGSDATIRAFRSTLPDGATLLGHGTGFGIAVGDDANAIASDLVVFDGKGCLSPRLVVALEDPVALGAQLHEVLLTNPVPRGPLTADDRAALARTSHTYAAIGHAHVGPHHAVFVDPDPEAVMLAPPLRATVVVPPAVLAHLPSLAAHVAALGGSRGPVMSALEALCPQARRSPLGRMQKPPLDGPVDLR